MTSKFTRPRTTVTLRVGASAERVLIEVQDECGGLPSGDVNELFRPFEQRSADRTGMDLGLAFSRWGAEANDGRVYARNLAGKGCVLPWTCRGSQFLPSQQLSPEAPHNEGRLRVTALLSAGTPFVNLRNAGRLCQSGRTSIASGDSFVP